MNISVFPYFFFEIFSIILISFFDGYDKLYENFTYVFLLVKFNSNGLFQYACSLSNQFIANKSLAIDNFDKAVGSHEILHSVLGNAIGIQPKLFKNGYDGLKKYLNKRSNSSKSTTLIFKSILPSKSFFP